MSPYTSPRKYYWLFAWATISWLNVLFIIWSILGTFGRCRYVYYGRHSEGNRFIKNTDLWPLIFYWQSSSYRPFQMRPWKIDTGIVTRFVKFLYISFMWFGLPWEVFILCNIFYNLFKTQFCTVIHILCLYISKSS